MNEITDEQIDAATAQMGIDGRLVPRTYRVAIARAVLALRPVSEPTDEQIEVVFEPLIGDILIPGDALKAARAVLALRGDK